MLLHPHTTAIRCLIGPVRWPWSVLLLLHIRRRGCADAPLLPIILLNCSLHWWQFIEILLHRVRMLLNYGSFMHLILIITRCFPAWWFVFPSFGRRINRSTSGSLTVLLLLRHELVRIHIDRLRRSVHAVFVIVVHIGLPFLTMSRADLFHEPILNVDWSRHLVVRLSICSVYTSGWRNPFIEERSTSSFEATMSLGG